MATAGGTSKAINFPCGCGKVEKIFLEAGPLPPQIPVSDSFSFPPPCPSIPNRGVQSPGGGRRNSTTIFLQPIYLFLCLHTLSLSIANPKQQQQNKEIRTTKKPEVQHCSTTFIREIRRGILSPSAWDVTYLQPQCLAEDIDKSALLDFKLHLHFILALGSESKTIGSIDKGELKGF